MLYNISFNCNWIDSPQHPQAPGIACHFKQTEHRKDEKGTEVMRSGTQRSLMVLGNLWSISRIWSFSLTALTVVLQTQKLLMLLAAPSFLVPGIFGARSEEQQFLLGEMRHSTAFGAPPIQIKPAQAIVLCSGFMVSQILHFPSCIILQPCESQGSHGDSHPQWPLWPPRICGPLACCSMPCLAARCPSNLLRPPGKATSRWRPRNGTAFRLKPRTLVTDGHRWSRFVEETTWLQDTCWYLKVNSQLVGDIGLLIGQIQR